MRADKVLPSIIKKNGMSAIEASLQCNRTSHYFSGMFARHTLPKIDTMADICDYLGWELVARDKSDGFEIRIDPPLPK